MQASTNRGCIRGLDGKPSERRRINTRCLNMVHGRMMHEIYRVIKISCAFCITPRAVRQETLVHICMRVSPRLILILAAVFTDLSSLSHRIGSYLNVLGNIRLCTLNTPKMAPDSAKSSRPVRIANCSGALSMMNTIHISAHIMILFYH